MDNITHALAGVTIAELALRTSSSPTMRRVYMTAAVVAASAPDIDLIYTWITPAPLGYLLHHRGHSHTWPGLLALGALIAIAFQLWPSARAVMSRHRWRFLLLLAASLASHLLLDALNVYGTHLLYPLTTRWYFGDAVFIFEPWVWLLLGVAVAFNAQRMTTKTTVAALTIVLPLLLAWFGVVSGLVLIALAAVGAAMTALFRRIAPRARAATALGGSVVLFVGMLGISAVAKAEARLAFEAFRDGDVVDIVSNPNPAVPWCWAVMGVALHDERTLVVRRGTLSLMPAVTPPAACASHRLMGGGSDDAEEHRDGIIWNDEWRGDVREMRALFEQNCWARPWFQFGRVPFVAAGRVFDLRFENPIGMNFSAMEIARGADASDCPSNLTSWEPPRIDVLQRRDQ